MNRPNHAPIMETSSPTSEVWHSVAFSLMLAMTFTWALSAIGFFFGASVGRLQATCGILLAVFLLFRQHRGARARWLSLSCLIAVLAGCLIISAVTVDNTYDGWAYHQPGVIALSHGWNPVTEPVFGTWWAPYSRSIGYPSNGPVVRHPLDHSLPKGAVDPGCPSSCVGTAARFREVSWAATDIRGRVDSPSSAATAGSSQFLGLPAFGARSPQSRLCRPGDDILRSRVARLVSRDLDIFPLIL